MSVSWVTFYAHVNHVGRSSMEIGVKVVAEHLRTNEKRHTTSLLLYHGGYG